MAQTKIEKLLDLAALKQTLRPKDLERAGIPRNYLGKLVRRGKLQKLARGLYTTDAIVATENISLLEVSHRLSKGIICLLSALRFHDIGSESPSEVWIALPQRFRWNPKVGGAGHHPRVSYPPVRIVRFSEEALQFGVQEHRIGEEPFGCSVLPKPLLIVSSSETKLVPTLQSKPCVTVIGRRKRGWTNFGMPRRCAASQM